MSYAQKYIFTLAIVIAMIFVGRSRLNSTSLSSGSIALNNTLNSDSVSPSSTSSASSGPPSQTSTVATKTKTPAPSSNSSTGQYKDGTYTGQSADAYYGNVQVQAVIANGKITNINFLSYPNDNGRSQSINSYALPQLKTEAIKSQSAKVNAISGASFSSQAFTTSLQSALSQA